MIRPEAIIARSVRVGELGDGVVERARRQGSTVQLTVRLDDGSVLVAVEPAIDHPAPGDMVSIEIDPKGVVQLGDGAATAP